MSVDESVRSNWFYREDWLANARIRVLAIVVRGSESPREPGIALSAERACGSRRARFGSRPSPVTRALEVWFPAPFRRRNRRVNRAKARAPAIVRKPRKVRARTMVRSTFLPAVLAIILGMAGSRLAIAQVGTIYNDGPRPPMDVPGSPAPRYPSVRPALGPGDYQDQGGYPDPRRESPGFPSADRGVPSVQSEPLPPPPGAEPVDPQQREQPMQSRPGAAGQPSGPPVGQRLPRGAPQPANTDLQPGDEIVTEPPAQKIANPTAVFSGLDKITGRTITFDVAINETVQFGALQVTPRVCYTRPPTEAPNTDGFVEVDEITLQGEARRIFSGWMFAASPGLHAVEHPIYDVWLIDCKGHPPTVASDATPSPQAVNAAGTSAVDSPATPASPNRTPGRSRR